jgi:hypothetical protein
MPGASCLATCLGKYRGGPSGGHMRVTYDVKAGGVVKGEYKGKAGGAAGFEGKMVDKGKKVLGFWCVQAGAMGPPGLARVPWEILVSLSLSLSLSPLLSPSRSRPRTTARR